MSYTVLDAKNDLTGVLHGTNLNQITGINNLFWRAARQVLLDLDPQETKRIAQFVNPIFNSVYDYAVPSDLKGNKVIDIRPQANRTPGDIAAQNYNQYFDANKRNAVIPTFTIQLNSDVKTIRMNLPFLLAGTTINNVDAITDNGTWVTGGQASNLAVNNVRFASGSSSLQFNLSAGGAGSTGFLENSTMTALDLTSLLNQGSFFLWVFLPTASNFNSINLRWGSSSANFFDVTATVNQNNTAFVNGWNLIAFNWLGATVTGVPDVTKINYARVTYTYNGTAQTAVGLDNIVARLGQILEIEYYSKYLFSTVAGVWQETITDDSNLINLDTESYNLFFNYLAYLTFQQQQGLDATFADGPFYLGEYQKGLAKYQTMYKSEVQKPQSSYYQMPRRGYPFLANRGQYP